MSNLATDILVLAHIVPPQVDGRPTDPESVADGHNTRIAATASLVILAHSNVELLARALLSIEAEASQRFMGIDLVNGLEDKVDRLIF